LREKHFHNRVFDSLHALEEHLERALCAMENDPASVRSIIAWDWSINSVMNAN
jgi:hypothetical protein